MKEINRIYELLFYKYGKQGWWPINGKYSGKTELSDKEKFKVCLGAILTQYY